MRTQLFNFTPLAVALTPGLACLCSIWMLGETTIGFAVAFAMSAIVGTVAVVRLSEHWLASAACALADAVEESAASDYADNLDIVAHHRRPDRLISPVERLRASLKQREVDLLADIETRAADAKLRKSEADAEALGYIEAHEAFMTTFTAALKGLASGDLSVRLGTPYSKDYEALRHCFNQSIDHLNGAFGATARGVHGLRGAVEEISGAMTDLAQRTGRQAASVKEASATLQSIVKALGKTAEEARSAADTVATTRRLAEAGALVVARAIEAMKRIQNSAGEIETIISVIDKIAFQTSLLALNAGVEAARAGESGKGFAVIASEVRALALRSAEAAKQIEALIAVSSAQVKDGVELVGETGMALDAIVGFVSQANAIVAAIALGTAEQKSMLGAVDEAVRQLDGFTLENAAFVERTERVGRSAREEATNINGAVAKFRLRGAGSTPGLRVVA
jgi:methyl-accepting chemotaxis protein